MLQITPDYARAQLAAIVSLWNKIEGRAKDAEQFRHAAISAAINEMRYAGRRIVDVVHRLNNDDGSDESKLFVFEQLVVARTYLINADHDLTDATCFFAHKRIARILELYGKAKIVKYVPEFEEFYAKLRGAQILIQGSREDRATRIAAYEELATNYLPQLREIYDRLVQVPQLYVDDTLPSKIGVLQRYVFFVSWVTFIGAVAGVVALPLGAVALIIAMHTDHALADHIRSALGLHAN